MNPQAAKIEVFKQKVDELHKQHAQLNQQLDQLGDQYRKIGSKMQDPNRDPNDPPALEKQSQSLMIQMENLEVSKMSPLRQQIAEAQMKLAELEKPPPLNLNLR